jgi:hypothetical protein
MNQRRLMISNSKRQHRGLATNAFCQAPILWHLRPFMGGPLDPAQVDRQGNA